MASAAGMVGAAGRPRASTPTGKRAVAAPIDGRNAERITHVVQLPSSHRQQRSASPAKSKSIAGKATPTGDAAGATPGRRPGKISARTDAPPSTGGKKKPAPELTGAAGVSSVPVQHRPHHHPLSNASTADEVVFHADLGGSSRVADPRNFEKAAGAASTAAVASGVQSLNFEDIPHARFASPGLGHVAGAARPAQAGELIFGGAPQASGVADGHAAGRKHQPHTFGASTDVLASKWAHDQQATRGKVDQRLYAADSGAHGMRTAAAADAAARSKLGAVYHDDATRLGAAGRRPPGCASQLGAMHGEGVSYQGAGREAVATQPGHAGQPKWLVGEEDATGRKLAGSILASAGSDDGDEWAGKGGGPERSSAGRPGQQKWHVGGDYVGVRPVADISDLVIESEQLLPSAGGY